MELIFFSNTKQFSNWLEKNHLKEKELYVGFYKKSTGKPSMTWSESVDVALCFGWIDGVRKSVDSESYCNRFSPRKADSTWSAINIKKVEELKEKGLMREAGLKAFVQRTDVNSKIYSYEKGELAFSQELLKEFRKRKKAWKYFQALAPSYRKVSIHWVMSARQDDTRMRRLEQLIKYSETGTNPWKNNKYAKK